MLAYQHCFAIFRVCIQFLRCLYSTFSSRDYYLPVSFHKGVEGKMRLVLFSSHISRNDFLLWEEASIFHKRNNYFDDLHNFTRQRQCLFTIMIAAQPLIKKTLWLIGDPINYVIANLISFGFHRLLLIRKFHLRFVFVASRKSSFISPLLYFFFFFFIEE